MEKLIELGFKQSANVKFINDELIIKIESNEHSTNLLYAFVLVSGVEIENWHVRYIGHTRKSFKNRMYGYQQGNGNAVNNRIHKELINSCSEGKKMIVYTLSNTVQLNLHSLFIDVAAGLEYSLIEYYQEFNHNNNHPPLQNIAGNKKYVITNTVVDENLEIEEKIEEDKQYINESKLFEEIEVLASFEQNLNKPTYWDFTYINIPTRLAELFGASEEEVTLSIIENNLIIKEFSLQINRTANTTYTPRLYIPGIEGQWFQDWKHNNYNRNGSILFEIIGRNRMIIKY
jgi:hypothetical protein